MNTEQGENRGTPVPCGDGQGEGSNPSPKSRQEEETTSSAAIFKDGDSGENKENASEAPEPTGAADDDSGQSSPRGVLDIPITGATDSDSSGVSSTSNEPTAPDGSTPESHSLQWRALIGGLLQRKKSMRRVSTFPPAGAGAGGVTSEISRRNFRRKAAKIKWPVEHHAEQEGSLMLDRWKPSWRSFDYEELAAATNNFSSENLIGKGGHAEVYRGSLPDGQLVAVKKLTKKETEEERIGDFLSELGIIAHVNHPNAACLLGFGVEGGLHLVLKFSPHGSLASVLHGSKGKLEWETRFKIALGVAQGLLYLHQGCHRRIIHRDIKASNILLTEDYQPQISDFGLAKWLPDKWTHHVVFPIEGTFGYLAPEYFMHGVVSEKTDVFAFGVLLLEIITGRRAVDSSRQSLVIWAKPLLDAKDLKGLIDPCLEATYDPQEMTRLVSAASSCIHHLSNNRPHMDQVVKLLRGVDGSAKAMGREAQKVLEGVRKTMHFDSDELEEDYTRSKYLNDLDRHKQLALEQ